MKRYLLFLAAVVLIFAGIFICRCDETIDSSADDKQAQQTAQAMKEANKQVVCLLLRIFRRKSF